MHNITSFKSLIELKSLNKKINGKKIISGLNLNINYGEFITILGPSGCGKTTILRLIAGLEYVDNGYIFIENKDVTKIPAEKRHVNTVFQNYALFPHMSVFDNIAFGLKMKKKSYREIQSEVYSMLCMIQLEDLKNRYPHQLSGGQQQRVAIARAIINKPKVLLLDECLSALDFHLRKQMQNELKSLQRYLGITFIYVTHDQEEALAMSDRIIVMRNGKIEQDSTPYEIYKNPKNIFVAKFIGSINILNSIVLYRINKEKIRAIVEGYECNIYTKLFVHNGQYLKVLLRPEDLQIKKYNKSKTKIGLIGNIYQSNYKGVMFDIEVKLNNGKKILVCSFFNENQLDINSLFNKEVCITWMKKKEIVLLDEKK
ncbi:MAG: spermidine/putrescine ABC transporter ATP-binding protein PotA [Arsenophonus sp.]|nr:MAG: spermidine/putrescine ABC transporter ATP-binding protein PotA [Arsenophonus sp.]